MAIYSDFSTAFLQSPLSGDLGMIVDENSIRSAIKNLVLTNKYERVLNPQVGTNLSSLLFENMDGSVVKVLQDNIKETINNWEPRVNIIDIKIIPYPDQNGLNVSIVYSLDQFPQKQILSIPITRSR